MRVSNPKDVLDNVLDVKNLNNSVDMTVKLDTTLQKYEVDGGDPKFIKDVTDSVKIGFSRMKITNKR